MTASCCTSRRPEPVSRSCSCTNFDVALFLKRTIPASGLAILPKTGHTLNPEEPALFN
jgi:hypothetical protein